MPLRLRLVPILLTALAGCAVGACSAVVERDGRATEVSAAGSDAGNGLENAGGAGDSETCPSLETTAGQPVPCYGVPLAR